MLIALPHLSERQLVEFLLGNLPDTESAQIEVHLEGCQHCTQVALRLSFAMT